jgi:hypothetical protein
MRCVDTTGSGEEGEIFAPRIRRGGSNVCSAEAQIDRLDVNRLRRRHGRSSASADYQMFDPLDFFRLETELENIEIRSHVIGNGGSGQR